MQGYGWVKLGINYAINCRNNLVMGKGVDPS